MAYPQHTIKFTMGGAVGSDIWRSSFHVVVAPTAPPLTLAEVQPILNLVEPKVATFWNTGARALNSGSINYSFLSASYYAAGSSAAAVTALANVTSVAGTGSGPMPHRTALVASLRTAGAGPRNRGRMYVPATAGLTLDTGGQTSPTVPNTVATALAALFNDVNDDDWSGFGVTGQTVVVTSVTRPTNAFSVSAVRVNSLPDTQRRRTNKVVPSTTATVTVVP